MKSVSIKIYIHVDQTICWALNLSTAGLSYGPWMGLLFWTVSHTGKNVKVGDWTRDFKPYGIGSDYDQLVIVIWCSIIPPRSFRYTYTSLYRTCMLHVISTRSLTNNSENCRYKGRMYLHIFNKIAGCLWGIKKEGWGYYKGRLWSPLWWGGIKEGRKDLHGQTELWLSLGALMKDWVATHTTTTTIKIHSDKEELDSRFVND